MLLRDDQVFGVNKQIADLTEYEYSSEPLLVVRYARLICMGLRALLLRPMLIVQSKSSRLLDALKSLLYATRRKLLMITEYPKKLRDMVIRCVRKMGCIKERSEDVESQNNPGVEGQLNSKDLEELFSDADNATDEIFQYARKTFSNKSFWESEIQYYVNNCRNGSYAYLLNNTIQWLIPLRF